MVASGGHERSGHALKDLIRTAVGERHFARQNFEEDQKYQDSFSLSSQSKADWIIQDLQRRTLDLVRFGYLSVGGADGSEIQTIMQVLPIKYGVLLEYSTAGTQAAAAKVPELADGNKTLHIVPGDAMQKIEECVQWLRDKSLDGIVCSIQAVLHELPRRSPSFDLDRFLARVFRKWNNIIFYCREPCAPAGWPDRIEIQYKGLPGETLVAVANSVKEALGFSGDVEELTNDWVLMPSDLAVETMVKLFYFHDFSYEMQEKWVSIDADTLITSVGKLLSGSSIEPTRMNSDSFSRLFRDHVSARTTDNTPRPAPYCFIRLIATRLQPSANEMVDGATPPPPAATLAPPAPGPSAETRDESFAPTTVQPNSSASPGETRAVHVEFPINGILGVASSHGDHEVQTSSKQEPCLRDLWWRALTDSNGSLYDKAEPLLVELEVNSPNLGILPLTPLQADVLAACSQAQPEHPFRSTRHLILAGPTSSGKTTIADILMVSNCFANGERTRAIYVAPTRALAQAKFRELRRRLTTINDDIILSTGEDTTDDRRLVSGDFNIACLVYEKANILLSRPSRLLATIGCMVVDELHMLMDVERGPLLEVLIAKLLMLRERIEGRVLERSRGSLRIVVISTEDNVNDALMRFLATQNPTGSDENIPPLLYKTMQRPIRVHHHLVLPPVSSERELELVNFTEFVAENSRTILPDGMKHLSSQLAKLKGRADAVQKKSGHTRSLAEHEHRERMMRFLSGLLENHPVGRRLLVFVPSQQFAVERARELRNQLARQGRRVNSTYEAEFASVAEDIDDVETAKTVADCAKYGVWIHHADIDGALRVKIETICEDAVGDQPTEVIFATTTLAYGINLTVHDVILFGTVMSAADRSREVNDKPLSNSEFHNIIGRVGRLGKIAPKERANVYISVPVNVDPFTTCIKKYYGPIDPARSRLFVEDDLQVVRRARKRELGAIVRGGPQAIKATSISYPFARAALDALRFVNIAESRGREKIKRPFDELAQFFSNTLFFHETSPSISKDDAVNNATRNFLDGLQGVILDCTNPNLNLVDKSDGEPALYSITELGESIINTGTDIRTVEPLSQLRRQMREVWAKHASRYPSRLFPLELLIIAIIAQSEVLRQYAKNCPECRSPHQRFSPDTVVENRASVQRIFEKAIRQLDASFSAEEVTSICGALTRLLDTAGPARDFEASYTGGATDAAIRLFSAVVSWISGDKYPDVVGRVNYNMTAAGEFNLQKPIGRMRNFRQLAELISWRINFLGTMLATERHEELSPTWQRELANLSPRVRLGCASDAVPLFWPRSSNLRRPQARGLLDHGLTPGVVAATYPVPRPRLPRGVYIKLRQDIQNFSRKAFTELAEEMTAVPGDSEVAGKISSWWRTAARMIGPAMAAYDVAPGTRIDQRRMIRLGEYFARELAPGITETNTLAATPRESQKIRLSEGKFDDEFTLLASWRSVPGVGYVFRLHGEYPEDPEARKPKHSVVEVLFVQAFSDSRMAVGAEPTTSQVLMRQLAVGQAACIVPCPWFPGSSDESSDHRKRDGHSGSGTAITVVTMASFLTMATLVTRGFVSGKSFFESIAGGGHSVNRRIGMPEIEVIIEGDRGDRVPVSIMEKMVTFFEVMA